MGAFHPRTFELLREDRAVEVARREHALGRLSKLRPGSKSQMAETLHQRCDEAANAIRDLDRLLDFAETVNRLHDEHTAGLHNGWPRRACDDCPGADGIVREPRSPAAAEVLSRTPLAVAFGDAEPAGGA